MVEPTTMALAPGDARGRPHARVVLFKGFVRGGFTFYTNQESAKGTEIAANARVALTFWWDRLERQGRIEGRIAKLPRARALRYFQSRPRVSQLGAWVSRQSRVVMSREALDTR